MKATAIATALLLAVAGSAVAQQDESIGRKTDRTLDRAEAGTQRALKGPDSIGRKADRAFDRMEDGTRRAWNRVTGKDHEPARSAAARTDDTRTMGAGAATTDTDAARRERMDEAYRNWQQSSGPASSR